MLCSYGYCHLKYSYGGYLKNIDLNNNPVLHKQQALKADAVLQESPNG
jgi:hypothetical protein